MIGQSKLINTFTGQIATISELGVDKFAIIQLQCPTRSISQARLNEVTGALKQLNSHLGDRVIIVGHDVNVYELTGEQAVMLRLEGTI
jgi:ABC-type lipoprotein export system ATPase subunit